MSAGLKTVMPSNPYDAKGLLIAAIEDADPVIFLEPKRLYNGPFDGHHDRPSSMDEARLGRRRRRLLHVPLGQAAVRREGADVTVLAYGTMVHVARRPRRRSGRCRDHRPPHPAAARLEAIVTSVPKTGRCVVVHEATLTSRVRCGAAALVQEACFYPLEAPVERVSGWDTPYPHAQEWDYFPGPSRVGRALLGVVEP